MFLSKGVLSVFIKAINNKFNNYLFLTGRKSRKSRCISYAEKPF